MWSVMPVALLFFLQASDPSAEGMKALEAGKYDVAAQAFSQAVAADPKDYGAHFHLGLSYSLLNKEAEAVAEYRKVLELKPGLYEAELNLGMVLLRQKQAREAVPLLQSAAAHKADQFRPRFFLAEALLAVNDLAKAEEAYRAALELDTKSAGAELGLARAKARQNRLDEAAPHFRKAVALDPSFKNELLELAWLYEKDRRPAEAIAIYQEVPESAAAQERLGELLVETKRFAEAIPRLEDAVRQDPTSANRLALATAYRMNKEPQKALPVLEQAVVGEPQNYDLRMFYGRVLRDGKQYQPAAQQFYAAIKIKPDSREGWNELAGMLMLLDNYPQALAALDRSRQLGETTPANDYFHAIILDKMRDYKPALESYQRFLAASQGKSPDEEFKARQRIRIIQKELSKR